MSKKAAKADKLGKREKLNLILAELAKLRGEVKLLTKQQAGFVAQIGKLAAAKNTRSRSANKASKSATAAKSVGRKSHPAPKRPVLVAPAEVGASTPRSAAQ
jgi:uncharacterized protein involved in exopolysaccharide biosynthesis